MNERTERPYGCPPWCVVVHGLHAGEEDHVHVSSPLCVRDTLIHLCSSFDPATGEQDGPYVLVGHHEFSLDEAGDLVVALTALIEQTGPRIPRPRTAGS
ncbi:MAG TPA: hypothetical protein VLB29_07510 [Nocardioidaceae bacterium]|nr:hypothetical protein [Nocardioidaceae bacterium]